MDLIITIISEKHNPTLTVKMDSEESAFFALHLIDVFADEVSLEKGLIVRGRTYQQKTPELIFNLRMFIENHGSRKELWQLYEIMAELSDGEYYAIITQAISESDLPRPCTSAKASMQPTTTRFTPFSMIRSAQGGVLP